MSPTDHSSLHVLARALLLGVGPREAVHALSEEFGWDCALLTLAALPEPEARTALWHAVSARVASHSGPSGSRPHLA